MSSPDGAGGGLPTALFLRRAAGEVDELSAILRDLERAIWERMSHAPPPAAKQAAQLQSFDLLSQRLRGLAAGLKVAAAATSEDLEMPILLLRSALPLGAQRAALLGPAPAGREEPSPELF